jgi:hypothetical protein
MCLNKVFLSLSSIVFLKITCASFTSIVIFVDTFVQLFANFEFQKFSTNNQTIPLLKAPPNFCYNYFFSDKLPQVHRFNQNFHFVLKNYHNFKCYQNMITTIGFTFLYHNLQLCLM